MSQFGVVSKLKSYLYYNRFTKLYYTLTRVKPSESIATLNLNNYYYHAIFGSATLAMMSFYLQIKNTQTRKETFARNYAILDQVLGKFHREAFGENTRISKFGYPDIGNNIYADLLPYKDWVKINNAQRCHENLVQQLPIVYCNTFIGLLRFPRATVGLLYLYIVLRVFHIKGYLSFRGHNKALAAEEFSKLLVMGMAINGVLASLSILGLLRLPNRLSFLRKIVPSRFRKQQV